VSHNIVKNRFLNISFHYIVVITIYIMIIIIVSHENLQSCQGNKKWLKFLLQKNLFPLESTIVLEICILLMLEDNWGFIVGNCFENFKSTNVLIKDDECLMSHNLICSSCN